MHGMRYPLIGISTGLALLLAALMLASSLPTGPATAQPIFATNTPQVRRAPDLLDVTPEGAISSYALRLWNETLLIDVLLAQIERLTAGEQDQAAAIRYTQRELQRRFPSAPSRESDGDRLLTALLAAPRGTLDLRQIARPAVVARLNRAADVFPLQSGTLEFDNFRLRVTALNLDAAGPMDLLIDVTYPADAGRANAIYHDVFPVIAGQGAYGLVGLPDDLPAAPYGAEWLTVQAAEDLNGDRVDELLIRASGIEPANDSLFALGYRAGRFVHLTETQAPMPLGFDTTITLDAAANTIRLNEYRLESERWFCLSQLDVTWRYNSNLFRRDVALNARFADRDNIGCALHRTDPPVFARPPESAITLVSDALFASEPSAPGYDRATMALATLSVLNGDPDAAAAQLDALAPLLAGNDWLMTQAETMRALLDRGAGFPLQVCTALLQADPSGACNLDQVIERLLVDAPVRRDADLRTQLEAIGLPVLRIETVTAVGRAPRELVQFNLPGASWWAFAPTTPDFYIPEPSDPPPGFTAVIRPDGPLAPPPAAVAALIEDDAPVTALNIVENLLREAPAGQALSLELRYLQALAYDLQGDRTRAREAYFALWQDAPASTWGALAGIHLERRG